MDGAIITITGVIAGVFLGQSLLKLFSVHPRGRKRISLYLLLGITPTMPSWVGDENPIILFPFFMLGFLLLLPGERLPKLIMGGIFFTLLISLNMLVDSQSWSSLIRVVITLCKALVWCALALFLRRIAPKGGLRLSRRLWLLVGGLTLAPLMAMLSFSIWGNNFIIEEEYQFYHLMLRRVSFTILPFVMVSALTLLIAVVVLSRHEALERENALAALRDVYYTGLRQEQTGLRTLRHDLRNHVAAMQGLLEQGGQEPLSRYLAELACSPALGGGFRYCENETANVVLSSKAAQISELGLTPHFEATLPEALSIPAPELCALLGNALDNAAAGAVGSANKTVTLRARLERGVFMLQVQNAIGGAVNPNFSSTKANAERHGLGLAGMREITARHGGSLEAVAENGRFELLVCFPCREL